MTHILVVMEVVKVFSLAAYLALVLINQFNCIAPTYVTKFWKLNHPMVAPETIRIFEFSMAL